MLRNAAMPGSVCLSVVSVLCLDCSEAEEEESIYSEEESGSEAADGGSLSLSLSVPAPMDEDHALPHKPQAPRVRVERRGLLVGREQQAA